MAGCRLIDFVLHIDRSIRPLLSTALIAHVAVPAILAVTLHEAAHGYVARRCGDVTAHAQRRVSLNPLRHVDPIGTVLVPVALFAASKFFWHSAWLFGWAKPVPVNEAALRNPRRDIFLVAAAGPAANLLLAFVCLLVFVLAREFDDYAMLHSLYVAAAAGVLLNASLAGINLIPLPPLDGGNMLRGLLPRACWRSFARAQPYTVALLLVWCVVDEARWVLRLIDLMVNLVGAPLGVDMAQLLAAFDSE
jgi:Zn-dependent protease